MDNLGRTTGLSAISGKVWAVQKKRRAADHHRRERKRGFPERDEKKQEETREASVLEPADNMDESLLNDDEDQVDYGSFKGKKRPRGKVDLVI